MNNILDKITQSLSDLSKAERKVATIVLKDPQSCVDITIADLAHKAEVSDPTVHRFCKRFGFEGFPEFKIALGGLIAYGQSPKVQKVAMGDSVQDIIQKVTDATIKDIQTQVQRTDSAIMARAIDLVSQARRIVLCASSYNVSTAQELQERLLTMGIACEFIEDNVKLELLAVTLRAGDLLIAISANGFDKELIYVVRLCLDNNVNVITLSPEGSDIADLALNLNSGNLASNDSGIMTGITVQKVMLHVLCEGVKLRRHDSLMPLSPKISEVLKRQSTKAVESKVELGSITKNEDRALKPNEPITTINWNY